MVKRRSSRRGKRFSGSCCSCFRRPSTEEEDDGGGRSELLRKEKKDEEKISDKMLYSREEDAENEDIWDDSALIRMYEASVSAATRKVKAPPKKEEKKESGAEWKPGDRCLAPYYEEDLWYPATVTAIAEGRAEVLYDGYDAPEWVQMEDLADENGESMDEQLVDATTAAASSSSGTTSEETPARGSVTKQRKKEKRRSTSSIEHQPTPTASATFRAPIPSLAPPPPPTFAGFAPPAEDEALSSMLMSWYMSGYHTGYYQALNDLKKSK